MSEGGQGPSACLPVRGLHKGPTSVMPFQQLNLWLRLTLVIRAPFHTVSAVIQLLGYLVSIDLRTIIPVATKKDTSPEISIHPNTKWIFIRLFVLRNWLICFFCYHYFFPSCVLSKGEQGHSFMLKRRTIIHCTNTKWRDDSSFNIIWCKLHGSWLHLQKQPSALKSFNTKGPADS